MKPDGKPRSQLGETGLGLRSPCSICFSHQGDTKPIQRSPHLSSLAECFLTSPAWAAAPAQTLASDKVSVLSDEDTQMSKAAGLPLDQFWTRTSAGLVGLWSGVRLFPASILTLRWANLIILLLYLYCMDTHNKYASNRYSPRQDSSGISCDESQAEPGGGFGKGPAHSHCKAICYPRQTSPSLCSPTSVRFNCQWDEYPSKFLALVLLLFILSTLLT